MPHHATTSAPYRRTTTRDHDRPTHITLVALALSTAIAIPLPLTAQRDTATSHHPHTTWIALAAALAATAAADAPLRTALTADADGLDGTLARFAQPLGRARTAYTGLATSYVAATIARSPRWARATWHVAAGYIAADAITASLKGIAGRHRPSDGHGPFRFRPSLRARTDWDSFPSGHATHAFAIAAGIAAENPDPRVTIPTYTLAALVGWSRVHDRAHWTSDVLAGAATGILAARTTIAWLHHERAKRHTTFTMTPGTIAVNVTLR